MNQHQRNGQSSAKRSKTTKPDFSTIPYLVVICSALILWLKLPIPHYSSNDLGIAVGGVAVGAIATVGFAKRIRRWLVQLWHWIQGGQR